MKADIFKIFIFTCLFALNWAYALDNKAVIKEWADRMGRFDAGHMTAKDVVRISRIIASLYMCATNELETDDE